MKKSAGKIGVFDSGFGGIDILREIVKKLPQYEYLYLGDTARTPYGTRTKPTIYRFTEEAVGFLFKQGCELVIIACNTASSDALRQLQRTYVPKHYPTRRVLGVLIPAAEEAIRQTKNDRIGVIATEGTVNSGAFVREIHKLNPRVKVFQQASPLLVPLVEAGEHNSPVTTIMLTQYLKPLLNKKIDTLILGCTHYGILSRQIKKIVGENVKIVSEAEIIPRDLKLYLNRHPELSSRLSTNSHITFNTTDTTDKFTKLGSQFFKRKIKAKKITL